MRTREGLTRLITFADAVVAISITLLVLPLVDFAAGADQGESMGTLLSDHAGQIYSFLLSFAVIMRFWLGHHRLVEHVRLYDPVFLWATALWMLTIVAIPFVTELIAVYGTERPAIALYIGVLALNSFSLSWVTLHVVRTPRLRADDHDGTPLSGTPSVVTTVLLVVAFAIGVALPSINYFALLLLLLSGSLATWWDRRSARARALRSAAHSGR